MCDKHIPSLIVIGTAINQLETKVYITKNNFLPEALCCCLQTCNVAVSEEIVGEICVSSLSVINSTVNKSESKVSLITIHCLRLFVVVYRVEIL